MCMYCVLLKRERERGERGGREGGRVVVGGRDSSKRKSE